MQHFEMFKHYVLDDAWDEMRLPDGMARPQYQELLRRMSQVTAQELASRQRVADDTFLAQGVTFTVYGHEDGTEKIFPFDLVPRIITDAQWRTVERGLTQRITALNMFLHDIYHDEHILNDGIVPRDLV